MIHYVNSRSVSDKNKIVKYIYEANKEFYDLFGKTSNRLYLDLYNMINDERTEEFNSKSIFLNDDLIGIISTYDSDEIYYRQLFSLNHLQNSSDVEPDSISSFSKNVPNIEKKSLYLSRIAISEDFRGQGYSTGVLRYLEEKAGRDGYQLISLHVHFRNKKAISVYKKYGFTVENDKYDYLVMLKEIN
jgi:ribosomal protein S18 acetylase RimI-like enzyme